jgi:hypothetical protein
VLRPLTVVPPPRSHAYLFSVRLHGYFGSAVVLPLWNLVVRNTSTLLHQQLAHAICRVGLCQRRGCLLELFGQSVDHASSLARGFLRLCLRRRITYSRLGRRSCCGVCYFWLCLRQCDFGRGSREWLGSCSSIAVADLGSCLAEWLLRTRSVQGLSSWGRRDHTEENSVVVRRRRVRRHELQHDRLAMIRVEVFNCGSERRTQAIAVFTVIDEMKS